MSAVEPGASAVESGPGAAVPALRGVRSVNPRALLTGQRPGRTCRPGERSALTLSDLVRPRLARSALLPQALLPQGITLGWRAARAGEAGVESTAGGPVRLADGPLPVLPGAEEPPLAPWQGGRRVMSDGRGIFVRSTPAPEGAEPALFVHGIGGSSLNWTDVTHLLGGELACEAMDLPGFGRSDPPPDGDYSLEAHASAVIAVIEEGARGPVHLVGNSLGGAVSTRVAALRPDLVRTLTLVSPALPDLRVRRRGDPVAPLLLLPGIQRLARRWLEAQTAEARAKTTLELCYYDVSRVAPERFREAADEVRYRSQLPWGTDCFTQSLRGLIAAYLQRGAGSLWRQAASVRRPVLLIWGKHDRLVDVRLAARAQETFTDSRLLVLTDAGHVAQLESPETVARAILGRIEEVREADTAA